MDELQEALLTSSTNSPQFTVCLWNYSNGNSLRQYKNGGTLTSKSLNLINNDYILGADQDKPMLHVWPLNSHEPEKKLGTILADKLTTLSLCPNSRYMAGAVSNKLYLWMLNSGKLLTIQKKHFQPITCLKFSRDGSFLIVAGQDGMLIVYKVVDLVSLHGHSLNEGQIEPLYTKQDHTLPIIDVFVGSFGEKARFASVSADTTCKLYSLCSGTLLLNLVFEEALTCILFDEPCWNIYVGQKSGKIRQFLLKDSQRNEAHINGGLFFQGHEKSVTCLDLGMYNDVLASGSEDNFVIIWEVSSRQILRKIEHKGAITNLQFVLRHENFFRESVQVKSVVRCLEREVVDSDDFGVGVIQDFDIVLSDEEESEEGQGRVNGRLEIENAELRCINKQLYETAMKICRKEFNF